MKKPLTVQQRRAIDFLSSRSYATVESFYVAGIRMPTVRSLMRRGLVVRLSTMFVLMKEKT